MRIPLLILTTLLIAASPAAMAKESKKDTAPVFGKTYCRPDFSCADLSNPDKMVRIEKKAFSIANKCVKSRFFRSSKQTKFFSSSYGLNSSLCFKSKKMKAGKSGLAMTPKCCVVPKKGNKKTCQVVCTVYGRR